MNATNAISAGLFLMLISLAPQVSALASDKDQPVEIQADFAEMDDIAGTTDYIGNVIVTQGSIRMTGDKLHATFDDSHNLEVAVVDGRPAYFRQTPDGNKEDIEGQALRVEYYAKKNQLVLSKEAHLNQGDRLFEGYRINYDTARSVITGRGDPLTNQGKPSDGKPKGRIKVIIPPKSKPAP